MCLCFCAQPLILSGQTSDYTQQLSVTRQMLANRNYSAAAAQAEGIATNGREARLPELEAEATLLWGVALTSNPDAKPSDQVEGVELLRYAGSLFRRQRRSAKIDTIAKLLEELTGSAEIDVRVTEDERERRRRSVINVPTEDEMDERALTAIVDLQSKEITALTDSQLRQLVLLEQQGRLLDDFAFQALEDSLSLVQQERELGVQRSEVAREQQRRNFFTLLAVASTVLLGLLYLRFRASRKHESELELRNATIEEERQRSEELLLNILPAEIARELKENGSAKPRFYKSATVMFIDFVGFSGLAKTMPPERLIALLDEAFREMDTIVASHKVEKIKTIGDAYMCAAGLPVASDDHAEQCVSAGLEIQRLLASNAYFKARIGVHTGPVVAGVVGLKKFAYDVWGDTVNQAARLEAAGEEGRVVISEVTKSLLPVNYQVDGAGTFDAKNIGLMQRYFVSTDAG